MVIKKTKTTKKKIVKKVTTKKAPIKKIIKKPTIKKKVTAKKKNVFISFHNKDKSAKKLLTMQAKSSKHKLDLNNKSLNKPCKTKWKTQVKKKINSSDTTIVMIGKDTHKRKAIDWEIQQSKKNGNKILGVNINKDKKNIVPKGIPKKNVMNWKLNKIMTKMRGDK